MVVIIDNYDSFTYNLVRYVEELGHSTLVFKNDEVDLNYLTQQDFSHLIISPGPCTPDQSGISMQAITAFKHSKAILGVCLGHQAIGQVFGAKVVKAGVIRHGKTSEISVLSAGVMFQNIPNVFTATRYHSLVLAANSMPSEFEISAVCEQHGETEIMAIQHKTLPIFGLQFHPESLLTEYGHVMLDNFCRTKSER